MNQLFSDFVDKSQSQPIKVKTSTLSAINASNHNNNNNINGNVSDKANNTISYLHGNNRIIAQFNDGAKGGNGKISLNHDVSDDSDSDDMNSSSSSLSPASQKMNMSAAMAMNANGAIRQNVMKAKRTDVSTGRWTVDEQKTFVKGIEMYGKEWKKIALMIPTRTVVQIRTHAQKYFIKLARKEAIANNNPLLFNPKVSISSNPLKSSSVANVSPLSIQSTKPAMHETLSPSVSSDSDSSASSSMKKNNNNNKLQIKRSRLSYAKIPTDEAISPKMESKCIKQQVNTNANTSNKHQRSDTMISDELDLSRQLVVKKQKKTQTSSFVSIANDKDKYHVHNGANTIGLTTPVSISHGRSSGIAATGTTAASQTKCEQNASSFVQKKKNKILLPVAYEEESMEDGDHNIESSPCGISDLFYIFPNDPSHVATFPPLPKNEGSELLNMMTLDGFDDDAMDIATPLKQKRSSRVHIDDDTRSLVSSDDDHRSSNGRKASDIEDEDALYSSLVADEVLDDSVFDMTQVNGNSDINNSSNESSDLLITEEDEAIVDAFEVNSMIENHKDHSTSRVPQTPPRQKMSAPKEAYSPVPVSLFYMPPVIGEAELNDIFDEWKSSDTAIASASN